MEIQDLGFSLNQTNPIRGPGPLVCPVLPLVARDFAASVVLITRGFPHLQQVFPRFTPLFPQANGLWAGRTGTAVETGDVFAKRLTACEH